MDELAAWIANEARQEHPEAKSWSDLDSMCDANEYFMNANGELLDEVSTGGQLDLQKFFAMQEKVDARLRLPALS